MLIFEPEITRAIKSDVYYVSDVKESPLAMGSFYGGCQIHSSRQHIYHRGDHKQRSFAHLSSQSVEAAPSLAFVDQYTGEITGRYERLGFFSTMFKLHRWLLDSANPHGDGVKVGKMLVGISTLIFVIALISGVVIWWPRARNNFAHSMSIPFTHGWKGFWKGLHVAGGMYALRSLCSQWLLTGLTWSFD